MKLIFEKSVPGRHCDLLPKCDVEAVALPESLRRDAAPALPEMSEVDLSRHYTELNQQVHGVNCGFYPLGSCTMKYNPRIDEEMAALPGFTGVHPLAPAYAVAGCREVLDTAKRYLCEITGMTGMTFQPAAGAHGVGVGEHKARRIGAQNRLQGVQVHAAVGGRGDVHHLVATHGRRGRVGAVGGVGNDDLGPILVVPGIVVLLDEQHAGELAVSAGRRLEGHVRHAGDLTEVPLRGLDDLLAALHRALGGQGMDAGEAGQGSHLLVDAGVVLHGAGAQRIEPAVHAVDVLIELGIVAAHVSLAHLGEQRGRFPLQIGGQLHLGHVASGQNGAAATGHALFKDQLHASTPFTMATTSSNVSLETFSVAHHRTPPS